MTRAASPTRTRTRPPSPTRTPSVAPTRTPTRMPSPSRTPSQAPTATPSRPPTATNTVALTRTPTQIPSPSRTPSQAPTATPSRPPTATKTVAVTRTSTRAASPTRTLTRTPSRTPTVGEIVPLVVEAAAYDAETDRLTVEGKGTAGAAVVLSDAASGVPFANLTVDGDATWTYRADAPAAVPCRVRASSNGQISERNVEHASDFSGGCGGAPTPGTSPTPGRSPTPGGTPVAGMKHDLVVPMNYELGMHCTGFDFSYCCVLPPYNSILAQVVKTEKTAAKASGEDTDPSTGQRIRVGHPNLLESDPADHTVVVDPETGQKVRLLYWHEDQRTRAELATVPAGDCPGCSPTTAGDDPAGHILNTHSEGEKLTYWSSYYDLGKGPVDPSDPNAVQASGNNFANAVFRHLYIYSDAEGTIPNGTTSDALQLNFGIDIPIPVDTGPAGHALSSKFNPDGTLKEPHYLTYTGNTGTVVYTDAPISPFDDFPSPRADVVQLDNVPIVLTNPGIWEALGLPLTPFPDGIDLMSPDLTESAIRPYVRMTVEVVDLQDQPVLSSSGEPQVFFGNAPIDIPNCERCHSNAEANDRPDLGGARTVEVADGLADIPSLVASEYDYWHDTVGLSDWYARVKSAAISMLAIHDAKHGTGFLKNYNPNSNVQTSFLSRLGRQTVICQDCHADNVIGVLQSKKIYEIPERDRGFRFAELWGDTSIPGGAGDKLLPALTEAIHSAHLKHTPGYDGQGRTGSCQGCHPAHRSDGSLDNYPITLDGLNAYGPDGGSPNGDNRDAAGGCFVGRDVHSNPMRYAADAIPAGDLHLNAVGNWLRDNVANDSGADKGIWCTNCHTQLQRELYEADHLTNAVKPGAGETARDATSLGDLANQLNAANGSSLTAQDIINMLDPGQVGVGHTARTDNLTLLPWAGASERSTANIASVSVDATVAKGPDVDGEYNVAVIGLDPDHVATTDLFGNPAPSDTMLVPYDTADDGRDYWLSPGAPKCADCHAPPFVESAGGVSKAYALQLGLVPASALKTTDSGAFPINQPFKYSNFRYSKGHRGITCQGCHESPHGLYPTTPPGFAGPRAVDETTWEQAGLLNNDSSHGPLKCASCHETNANGTVKGTHRVLYNGVPIDTDLKTSIAWAHTFTAEAPILHVTCVRCHEDQSREVSCGELRTHLQRGRVALRHAQAVSDELGLGCAF
jgi:hypothetical protein